MSTGMGDSFFLLFFPRVYEAELPTTYFLHWEFCMRKKNKNQKKKGLRKKKEKNPLLSLLQLFII